MLDDHNNVNNISLLLVGEASRGVVEHDLVSGYLYGTEVVSQAGGTLIEFGLDHCPNR